MNVNLSLLPTKFLQPANLYSYLRRLISLQPHRCTAPHLLLLFLAHQPFHHLKPLIAHSDMHHLAFGINFQIHFLSLVSPVWIYFVYLSTHLSHHPHCYYPSLLYSFTPGSKPSFSTNLSHLNFASLPIRLPLWSWDWTGLITLISLFLVFFLLPFCSLWCGKQSWLWSVDFLLHIKYTVSYRISYRIGCFQKSDKELRLRWLYFWHWEPRDSPSEGRYAQERSDYEVRESREAPPLGFGTKARLPTKCSTNPDNFIEINHTAARYWYSKYVRLSVRSSVRYILVVYRNGSI